MLLRKILSRLKAGPMIFSQIKIALITRLDIPHIRIAQRLHIHRETIAKYAQKNDRLFNKIRQDSKGGSRIPDLAQKYFIPQTLAVE